MSFIINPYRYGGAGPTTYAAWDPARKTSGFTLSSSDQQADEASTGSEQVVTTLPKSSGKWYCEAVLSLASGSPFDCWLGLTRGDATIDGVVTTGQKMHLRSTNGFAFMAGSGGTGTNGASWASGDVLVLAYDAGAAKAWIGANGSWFAGGNPAAGTNTIFSSFTVGAGWSPSFIVDNSSANHRGIINAGQSAFTYTPPSGFGAWAS